MKTSQPSLESLPPRERILVAAHGLFYAEGIRATGVDRIIERSSVSKVTFYRQYASKDDLIRAYLDYRHERWISWFQASLAQEAAVAALAHARALNLPGLVSYVATGNDRSARLAQRLGAAAEGEEDGAMLFRHAMAGEARKDTQTGGAD